MTVLMLYTVSIARGLADFLDALADSRITTRQKLRAFARIWRPDRQ
ncbi:MAG: hypothetical protein ACR2FI_13410 [Burkholderiales bacterium]|nr:hypothetical protein [Burkholderiales bacterium]